jgi:murein DD-endopeptidase MepM/ murein hydrolase activator NlpD
MIDILRQALRKNRQYFYPLIPFDKDRQKLLHLDLSIHNSKLLPDIYNNQRSFSNYIDNQLNQYDCEYAVGGYNEERNIYEASPLFDSENGNRRLHIGFDIWGPAGTPVSAFMGGMVHSFAYHPADGDYGATLILSHQLEAISFYTLYGHISIQDIDKLQPGQYINRGNIIAHFGFPAENGGWPPHLHFQVIADMGLKEGDYPGVVEVVEREKYLSVCPDPDLITNMMSYTIRAS